MCRFLSAFIICMTWACTAIAQDDRPVIFNVGTQAIYEDNILRTPANKKDDVVIQSAAGVRLAPVLDRHAMTAHIGASDTRYGAHHSYGHQGYDLGFSGQYDVSALSSMMASVSKAQKYRGLNDDDIAQRPAFYTVTSYESGVVYRPGRFTFDLRGSFDETAFENRMALGGRMDRRVNFRTTYAHIQGVDAYVSATYNSNEYDGERNAHVHGHDLRSGVLVDPGGIYRGGFFIGRIIQDADRGSDISRYYAGGNASWDITRLTSLSFEYDHRLYHTALSDSAGVIQRIKKITLQTRPRERLTARLTVQLRDDHDVARMQGTGDKSSFKSAGTDWRYTLTRNAAVNVRYDWQKRDGAGRAADYTNRRLTAGLTYTF